MTRHLRVFVAAASLAAALSVSAQQPSAPAAAPPPPAFAPPNLTESGARSMAATCAACHGTNGHAAAKSSVGGLAGRSKDDIVRAMEQFRSGARPATVMHQIAKGYGDAEIAALADYFSRQR